MPILAPLAATYVEIIRNLPLLLIIFFVYFALPEIGIKFSIMASSIIALTVFEAAMLSEIIRSGLNSIDKGQIEAGRSSGLYLYSNLVAYRSAPGAQTHGSAYGWSIYFPA